MSGAESDSGLVDTRQSINLVVRNLQVGLASPPQFSSVSSRAPSVTRGVKRLRFIMLHFEKDTVSVRRTYSSTIPFASCVNETASVRPIVSSNATCFDDACDNLIAWTTGDGV